jgi:CheY-like chemotaxis protein
LKKDLSESAMEVLPLVPVPDARALIRQRYAGSRILIADDEPVNLEVVQRLLESVDLVTDVAADGQAALALAQQKQYQVILMDIQMPKLNGVQATRQIRLLPGYLHTPIIAVTAMVFAADRLRASKAGVDDFLIKPFDPKALFAILLRALTRLEHPAGADDRGL